MSIEVKVPQLPESVTDATLVNWHKKAGEPVRRDENLVDLETDKVVLEVPAPSDGVLKEIRVNDGTTVTSGQVLALLEPGDAAAVDAAAGGQPEAGERPEADQHRADERGAKERSRAKEPAAKEPGPKEPGPKEPGPKEPAAAEDQHAPAAADDTQASQGANGRPPVSRAGQARRPDAERKRGPGDDDDSEAAQQRMGPAARKLVEEHDIDAAAISGSGREGRVTKGDVLEYLAGHRASTVGLDSEVPAAAPSRSRAASRTEQRVTMTRLRARIAERLVEAQRTAAMLTTFNEVDMMEVMALRKRHQEQFEKRYQVRLGFMSFFVKAAIEALRRFPLLNAAIDGDEIVYHEYFDVGVAVSTDRGLLVPVLRNAETMSFAEIELAIGDFAGRARDGRIGMDELTGGTFTITNGGIFGSLMSTPILNPPQSGILGMHRIQQRPVVIDGEIVIRPMMYLALSYDHRIVDGREAVQFLVALKEQIEDPARLMLQV